jgi:hypothetical protein
MLTGCPVNLLSRSWRAVFQSAKLELPPKMCAMSAIKERVNRLNIGEWQAGV